MNAKSLLAALATITGLMLANPAVATESDRWEFDVLLGKDRIGYHHFDLRHQDGRQVLETEARFDVRFLIFPAFRYRHTNREVWNDGCLEAIDAITDNNGEMKVVSGQGASSKFEVISDGGRASHPGCVRTFAYWNPDILEASRLLNSQTGEYEPVTVKRLGADRVAVGEQSVDAMQYALTTSVGEIMLWYAADDGRWLALEAPTRGRKNLRYVPTDIPDAAVGPGALATRNGGAR